MSLQLMFGVDCRALNCCYIVIILGRVCKTTCTTKTLETQFMHILLTQKLFTLYFDFSPLAIFRVYVNNLLILRFHHFSSFHPLINASKPIFTYSLPENDCFLSQV